ncbi:GYD domain-containing protein [Streptomyces niveus]|uniref:GYD domain-containing protein n=1 Tax=Streptomyces niveus TaxID=193462 RepID=UPI0036DD6125
MPKFLIQATYTPEGTKGLLSEGASGRRAAVDQVVSGLGGKVEAMYFAFGEDYIVLIVDFPDPVSMAAVSLTVKASGALPGHPTPHHRRDRRGGPSAGELPCPRPVTRSGRTRRPCGLP